MLRDRKVTTRLRTAALIGAAMAALIGSAFPSSAWAQESGASSDAPPSGTPSTTPAPQDIATNPTTSPTPGVVVNANVETYFTYNFNRPADRDNRFIFNNRDREFGINYADVRLTRQPTSTSRVGFALRLIEGDVKRLALSAADLEESENLLEAYGSLLIPLGAGRDLKVDAGQFVTHVGYETIDIGTNNFFSRSFVFAIPAPFYNAGVRATLPIGPRTTVTGLLLNQFNGRSGDPYPDIAPGLQIIQTLNEQGDSLIFNGLGSREPATFADGEATETRGKFLSIYNLIYQNQLTPAARLVLEGVYRTWEDTEDQYGGAAYGIFTLGGGSILGLRGEYLKIDPDGGDGNELTSATLSFEPRSSLFPGARTLFEVRYDHSNNAIFGDDNNDVKKDQFTLTIGQVFSF
jgi:hypothetical protein